MTYDLYIEELDLEIELDYHLRTENNGIGSYEYWGSKEYDAGEDYLVLDDVEWDKSLYTNEQNELIDKYIVEHWDKIEEEILNKFDPSDYI